MSGLNLLPVIRRLYKPSNYLKKKFSSMFWLPQAPGEELVDDKFKRIINQKWSIDDDLIDSDDIDWGYLDKISGIEDKMLDYYKNLRFIEKLNPYVVSTLLLELTKGIASTVDPIDDEFEPVSNEEWRASNDFMISDDTDQKYFDLTEKLNPKTASILLPEMVDYI